VVHVPIGRLLFAGTVSPGLLRTLVQRILAGITQQQAAENGIEMNQNLANSRQQTSVTIPCSWSQVRPQANLIENHDELKPS
jgi:hypothetical protein